MQQIRVNETAEVAAQSSGALEVEARGHWPAPAKVAEVAEVAANDRGHVPAPAARMAARRDSR